MHSYKQIGVNDTIYESPSKPGAFLFSLKSNLKRYVEMNRAEFLHNVVRTPNRSWAADHSLN